MLSWWLSRSPHELDVIRTVATVITGGFGGVIIPLLGWGIRLLRANRRDAQLAVSQTAHTEYVDGKQRTVPVVDYARHAMNAGEASRHETADLAQWMRGNGRRRLPTSEVPRQEEGSHYE